MLRIADRALDKPTVKTLAGLQKKIDDVGDYAGRVTAANAAWKAKTGSKAKAAAFASIRTTLEKMCVGSRRCAYCEDSAADEVEHIKPKNLFPQHSFQWANYLFACGPCNGPKSNRYGTVHGVVVTEFKRGKDDPVIPPPATQSGFIDPRTEDPFAFLEMDLGGTTPDGMVLEGTFELLPRDDLEPRKLARAAFTIDVLRLNREEIRKARQNAFTGFRSRIFEYVVKKEEGATAAALDNMRVGILTSPHLSVFEDMRLQRTRIPEINNLIGRAPEMLGWDVVPA